MHLSTSVSAIVLLAATSAIGMAIPANIQARDVTAGQVSGAIDQLTTLSQQIQGNVQNISPGFLGVPLDATAFLPLTNGLQQINTETKNAISVLGSAPIPPFNEERAEQAICDSFHRFTIVQKSLLDTVSRKSVYLQSNAHPGVVKQLRTLEAADYTLANIIIDAVPSCVERFDADLDSLDASFTQAICADSPLGVFDGIPC